MGKSTTFQWKATHPRIYEQHKLDMIVTMISKQTNKQQQRHNVEWVGKKGWTLSILGRENENDQNMLYKILKELLKRDAKKIIT